MKIPPNSTMFLDDFPIVIWFIQKKKDSYILLDSCGLVVMRRDEKRKNEIYQYLEENGIDYQEEF
jgi:hypothetical protein